MSLYLFAAGCRCDGYSKWVSQYDVKCIPNASAEKYSLCLDQSYVPSKAHVHNLCRESTDEVASGKILSCTENRCQFSGVKFKTFLGHCL